MIAEPGAPAVFAHSPPVQYVSGCGQELKVLGAAVAVLRGQLGWSRLHATMPLPKADFPMSSEVG